MTYDVHPLNFIGDSAAYPLVFGHSCSSVCTCFRPLGPPLSLDPARLQEWIDKLTVHLPPAKKEILVF